VIDDTEKTYIIAVQREEAYSFDIEAESPEEAVKLMEAQMRKATAHSVPGGTLVRARWVPPSEKPWVIREADQL
jgi:hypothetical protein